MSLVPVPWRIRAAGLLALLPLGLRVADPAWLRRALGTEGAVELATELALLGLAGLGLRRRAWWIALAAVVLLAEEVDYGQSLFGYATPAAVDAWSPRNDRMNLHNIPALEWLWRPLPMLAMVALARRPWRRGEALLERLGAPRFHAAVWQGLALAVAGAALAAWFEPRAANESLELALVVVVAVSWIGPDAAARPAASP